MSVDGASFDAHVDFWRVLVANRHRQYQQCAHPTLWSRRCAASARLPSVRVDPPGALMLQRLAPRWPLARGQVAFVAEIRGHGGRLSYVTTRPRRALQGWCGPGAPANRDPGPSEPGPGSASPPQGSLRLRHLRLSGEVRCPGHLRESHYDPSRADARMRSIARGVRSVPR